MNDTSTSFMRRLAVPLRDPQRWLDLVWVVVGLVGRLFAFLDVLADFLKFAFSHVGDTAWAVHALGEASDGGGTCGFGQKLQFVEIFLGLSLVLCLRNQAHQDCTFGLNF